MQYCKGENTCKPTHGAIRLVLKTFRVTRTRQKGQKVTAFKVYRHTPVVLLL